jgi:hypothetical protein
MLCSCCQALLLLGFSEAKRTELYMLESICLNLGNVEFAENKGAEHSTAWRGVAWHGMAWHGMAWHGMTWHGAA